MSDASIISVGVRDRLGRWGPYAPAIAVLATQLVFFGVPSGVWVQGVVLGSLNALVAVGLALVWRSNRILNFAQADMGTLPAAIGVAFCIFWGWSWFAGLAIGLACAIAVGTVVEMVVIRRFRSAPRLTVTVATIGVAQCCILAALLLPRLWGRQVLTSADRTGYGFPWHFSASIGQQVFHADDLVGAVVAIVVLVGTGWFLRSSDTGIAIRAAAERSTRAELLGVPVLRMELITWIVAAVLSFLGVFLQGAINGFPLNISVGIIALVTALAALVMGGFDRTGPIIASAVALGVFLQGVRWHNTLHPSVTYALLGVVIAAVMVIRRGGVRRVDREAQSSWSTALEPRTLPRGHPLRRAGVAAAVLAAAVAVVVPIFLSPAGQFDVATLAGFGIIALSIAVLTGWAGQITLGQMGFAALGACLGAVATVTWQLDVSLGVCLVAVAGACAGAIVGLPALRHRGLLPAAVTLGFGLAASGYLFDPNQFTWIPTGDVVPRAAFGIWDISGPLGACEFALVVTAVCIVGLVGIRSSSVGRAIRAMRDNDLAARSYALSPVRAKLGAYAISGALASIGGFVLVHVAQHFDTATYGPAENLTIFTASVVGGVGSLFGVLLGAGYLNGSRWMLTGYWQLAPTAIGVLVVLWLFPGGFASLFSSWRDRLIGGPVDSTEPTPGVDRTEGIPTMTAESARPAGRSDADGDALLAVHGARVVYGGVDILTGVDLTVRAGEIVALLGTNGAGKSTLLRAVCGTVPLASGSVRFGDHDLTGSDAPAIARTGLAQMPGGEAVFGSLTVAENLRVAGWLSRSDPADLQARIEEAYARFGVLAERAVEPAANLSGGQQQLLGLAMSLLNRPSLLMIDELTLGLSPLAADDIIEHVRALRDEGTTVVVVEQSVEVALRLADRAYFLERGSMRFNGPAAELAGRDDLLRSVYLATDTTPERPRVDRPTRDGSEPPVLAVHDVSVAFDGPRVLDDVSLEIPRGEICVVIGPNGAGKTTLFDAISGFTPLRSGHIELLGTAVTGRAADVRAARGLGRSFQESRLFPDLTVDESIAVATNRWITGPDPLSAAAWLPIRQLSERATAKRVDELVERIGLGDIRRRRIGELSTGQRRLVDIAAALAHRPRVLLLDEPSSGVARAETDALVELLLSLRDALDATLVVVEHDLSVATALADRMIAMDLGRIIATGTPESVLAHERVVEAYLGRPAARPPLTGDTDR